MLTIKIELISNRYHANPWNRAHIEGVVEWPPSPWRLLRAFFSGGFAAGISKEALQPIVEQLAATLPAFYLPSGAYLQTRSPRKDRSDTVDLFKMGKDICDAYLNFDQSDRAIWVQWPVILSSEELLLLARCIAYCRYLGRREADAIWSVASAEDMPVANAVPKTEGTVVVAACDGDIEALLKSPYEVQVIEKRSVFPGLQWVRYQVDMLPTAGLTFDPPTYYRAELAISTKGKPKATSMLYWVEKLHYALAKLKTPNFTGCNQERDYLKTHEHVFIQPQIREDTLVGFILQCPAGFAEAEIEHLFFKVKKLYGRKGDELAVRVVNLATDRGPSACVWESETPFFLTRWPLTRHGKPRLISGTTYQKDGPEQQALRALCYLPQFLLDPKSCRYEAREQGLALVHKQQIIAVARSQEWPFAYRWASDRLHGQKSINTGHRISLLFPKAVSGPIAIGYSAHFGFGMLRERVGVDSGLFSQAVETVSA